MCTDILALLISNAAISVDRGSLAFFRWLVMASTSRAYAVRSFPLAVAIRAFSQGLCVCLGFQGLCIQAFIPCELPRPHIYTLILNYQTLFSLSENFY